ncbi:TlpA family protein disulfide reductase [Aquipuribacter sp. SD81]|uniref:TlpA family protein disulfide reductase n=1 Tax=Aquipuribacter sp. SD81 TaxID=3127703 RepID=UPI0030188929
MSAVVRSVVRAAPGVAVAALLAGCSAGQAGVPDLRDEADAAYVSGDATVQLIDEDRRGEPVEGVAGTTLTGEELDVADLRGSPVVLNVWGSWCGPCHEEAPDLVAAEAELAGRGVRFVGINVRDRSVEAAAGFEEEYGIGWPSLHDPGSQLLLPLAGEVPPNAVPVTVVLDDEGRVAAWLVNKVDRATLVGIVEESVGVVADGDGGAEGTG